MFSKDFSGATDAKRVSRPLSQTAVINILILCGVFQACVTEVNLFQMQSDSYR